MNLNGSSPYEPKSVFCYKGALMKWTSWGRKYIDYLVETGRLRAVQNGPHDYRRFVVKDVQEILEEELSQKRPNRPQSGPNKSSSLPA